MTSGGPSNPSYEPPVFDGASVCRFRRMDKLGEALEGRGDIDLLVDAADREQLTRRLRGAGGLRGVLRRCHDNAVPTREDWIVFDDRTGQTVHFDMQFGIAVGPRYAKHLRGFDFADAEAAFGKEPNALALPVASDEFQVRAALAKAAFRMRCLVPSGSVRVECDAVTVNGPVEVAGVRIPLERVSDTHVRVAVRDLVGLRRAIYRSNGIGAAGVGKLWLEHAVKLPCAKLMGALDLLGIAPAPKRRPAGGGVVVALLGPDGMGKSTQLEQLRRRFAAQFGTRTLYLGSSGFVSKIVLGLRSFRGSSPSRERGAETASRGGRFGDLARVIWGFWLALHRLYTVRRARRLARRGFVVLCDRWPQSLQRGLLDGPVRRRNAHSWGWVETLFAYEQKLYSRIEAHRPDIVFHLVAPYEVAEARKPGELTRAAYESRIKLLESRRSANPDTIEVAAEMPFEEVHRSLFATVWARLVEMQGDISTLARAPAQAKIWAPLNYSIGGQVVHTLGQFGVLISMSHLRGVETVGVFALAMSIVTPIFILSNMGLRTSQALDQRDECSFPEYAGFRVVTSSAALLFCILISGFLEDGTGLQATLIMFAIAKALESFSGLSYGTFLKHENVEYVFRSFLIRTAGTVLLFVVLLLAGVPLWIALFAHVIVWGYVALFVDLPTAYRVNGITTGKIAVSGPQFMRIFKRTYLVGGTNFLVGLQPALIRVFVEAYLGLAALGVFTNISSFFQAGAMLSNAIRQFLVSRFSRYRVQEDHEATRGLTINLLLTILALSAAGVSLVFFLGDAVLLAVFGAETAAHADLFFLISVALSFRLLSAITISLRFAYHSRSKQFLQETIYVVVLFALSPVLIPEFGVIGAGWILLIVSFLRFFLDGLVAALRIGQLGGAQVD